MTSNKKISCVFRDTRQAIRQTRLTRQNFVDPVRSIHSDSLYVLQASRTISSDNPVTRWISSSSSKHPLHLASRNVCLFHPIFLRVIPVEQYPIPATLLLSLGSYSIAKVLYQTLSVLLQTFILPGTSVSRSMTTFYLPTDTCITAQEVWSEKGCLGNSDRCI